MEQFRVVNSSACKGNDTKCLFNDSTIQTRIQIKKIGSIDEWMTSKPNIKNLKPAILKGSNLLIFEAEAVKRNI